MKKFSIILGLALVLLLGACSGDKENSSGRGSVDDGEAANGYGSIDHGVDDKKVGFSLTGETIEEAEGVPAAEKEQILQAFDKYIDAFNDNDIEGYLATLSKHSESFDLEEERDLMTDVLREYDLKREATDVTIVKYSENEAQVFAKLQTSMKQLASGLETNPKGRQVTVFTKDEGDWKVASVHFILDEE